MMRGKREGGMICTYWYLLILIFKKGSNQVQGYLSEKDNEKI